MTTKHAHMLRALMMSSALLAFAACTTTKDHSSVATTAAPPAAKPSVIRIKAGAAEPFKDSSGNVWQADTGFTGGSTIDRDPNMKVDNTSDPGLFLSEHYGMESFSTPAPNGKYLAKLYFAETFDGINGTGERVFSFAVHGREFKDFDVWAKAGGGYRAYVETIPVVVTNGAFSITFVSNIENPQINAIELIPDSK